MVKVTVKLMVKMCVTPCFPHSRMNVQKQLFNNNNPATSFPPQIMKFNERFPSHTPTTFQSIDTVPLPSWTHPRNRRRDGWYNFRRECEMQVVNTAFQNVGARETVISEWIWEFAYNENEAWPVLNGTKLPLKDKSGDLFWMEVELPLKDECFKSIS